MSKYSFIDIGKTDLNKQCYCIDVNTSKVPFNYDNYNDSQSFLINPHSPTDISVKVNTPSNIEHNNDTNTLMNKLRELENKNTLLNNELIAANDKSSSIAHRTPSDLELDNYSLKTNKIYHDINNNIHENFSEKDKEIHKISCSDVCSINNSNKILNENFYIFLIIVILLIFAYFTSKKSI